MFYRRCVTWIKCQHYLKVVLGTRDIPMQARRRHTGVKQQEFSDQSVASHRLPIQITRVQESEPEPSDHFLEMSCRDRTQEFMSAVKSMQSRQVNNLYHVLNVAISVFLYINKRFGDM